MTTTADSARTPRAGVLSPEYRAPTIQRKPAQEKARWHRATIRARHA